MCGSNSTGEPLPLHIMFLSDAKEENNYYMRADWVQYLPHIDAQFRHSEPRELCSSLTINLKGSTDACMLHVLLLQLVEHLFPNAMDVTGKCVTFKIDGGPGCMNIQLLGDLQSHGVYLFNGVQNATHITQEKDQNYYLFKSLL